MLNPVIRKIKSEDNFTIATIIRNSLIEFGANKPGTVFFDKATDNLFAEFQTKGSVYFVAELNNEVLGGAGIFHSTGLPNDTCELVKMYLLPQYRQKGIGLHLLNTCFEFARSNNYKKCYLETMPELTQAIALYEKTGFTKLQQPLGNTGHHGCDIWMLKNI